MAGSKAYSPSDRGHISSLHEEEELPLRLRQYDVRRRLDVRERLGTLPERVPRLLPRLRCLQLCLANADTNTSHTHHSTYSLVVQGRYLVPDVRMSCIKRHYYTPQPIDSHYTTFDVCTFPVLPQQTLSQHTSTTPLTPFASKPLTHNLRCFYTGSVYFARRFLV